MNVCRKWFKALIPGVATLVVGGAQAATGTANASVVEPLVLTESATLEFGQLSAAGGSGTVVIDAADDRTPGGSVVLEGGVARSGGWTVAGEASTNYTITLPTSDVTLTSGANSMTVNTFTDNKSGTSTTDGTGNDSFKVGATLNVGADQPIGNYTGNYTVTVAYQ